jgi:ribosome-binding protein aMBF1 (putative translation factor)
MPLSVTIVTYLSSIVRYILPIVNDKTREAICARVANLLRQERLKQKLSMTRLGERAGLSHQMISYVERKMRIPTLDTMLRISASLGVNLGELIVKADRAAQNDLK